MNVLSLRHVFKGSAKTHVLLSSVESKPFALSVCTEPGVSVLQDTRVVLM